MRGEGGAQEVQEKNVMKAILYGRPGIEHEAAELTALLDAFAANGFECRINAGFAETIFRCTGIRVDPGRVYTGQRDFPEEADVMVSYGGDGTFLDAVRMLNTRPVPVLGINSGRLGFLANVSQPGIGEALREIRQANYTTGERAMLAVEGDFPEPVDFPYAFPEFSIQKNGVPMVSVDVCVDGEPITTYLGDGIILSTPAGSTAYSLSVGGPIVVPGSRCFVLAPIASHNLTMRPLVVPDTGEVGFRMEARRGSSYVTLDNRDYTVPNGSVFRVRRAEKSVFLIRFQNISFYRTLREKMMWGRDSREIPK